MSNSRLFCIGFMVGLLVIGLLEFCTSLGRGDTVDRAMLAAMFGIYAVGFWGDRKTKP